MSKGKTIGVIVFAAVFLLASLIYYLYTIGVVSLPNGKEVTETVSEITTKEEPVVYEGSVFAIYVGPEVTADDVAKYAADFGGQVSNNKRADDGYYEITLKEKVPSSDQGYFLEEVRNHIAVEEVYFIK